MSPEPLSAPVAARLRRPSWRDPRLVVGVVLVALSVALGSTTVSAASRTTRIWVAAETLTPGDPVTPEVLRAAEVRLGDHESGYLRADEPLAEGIVATRVVGEGELVARSALGAADTLKLRSVAVEIDGALSDRVRKGGLVDVWFVPAPRPGGQTLEPRLVVERVHVEQRVEAGSSSLVVGSSATLHLLVPSDQLQGVLAAIGADGGVTVVPVAEGIS